MLSMIIDMTNCVSANIQFAVRESISINSDNVKSASLLVGLLES